MLASNMESPSSSRERAAQLLISAIRRLAAAKTLDTISEIVRSTARALVQADGATFVLRDGECCFYLDEDAISPLWKGQRFPLKACISGWSMMHQEQVVIPDIYLDGRIPHDAYRPTFVKSLVMTPVRRDPATAAIGTYWARERTVEPSELAFLQDLADATAVALENAELYADLERKVERRTLELQQLNKELEGFSYMVAHDLRAPLHVLVGFAELAEKLYAKNLDEKGRGMLREMGTAGRRMNALITDLLDFARCTKTEVTRSPLDLSALAGEIAERIRRERERPEVRVSIEPGLVAHADERLMAIVLTNLLDNAFKYTRKQSAPRISMGRRSDGLKPFFIQDNGAGFDATLASRLFEPFQRMHTQKQFEGTGVGLATVARIVHRHGGEVWAEASVNEGATFYFTLDEQPASPTEP